MYIGRQRGSYEQEYITYDEVSLKVREVRDRLKKVRKKKPKLIKIPLDKVENDHWVIILNGFLWEHLSN